MDNDIVFYNNHRNIVRYSAYAFIDSDDHCIIIVAGKKPRDKLIEHLTKFI